MVSQERDKTGKTDLAAALAMSCVSTRYALCFGETQCESIALVRLDFREAAVTNLELTIKRTVPDRNVMN